MRTFKHTLASQWRDGLAKPHQRAFPMIRAGILGCWMCGMGCALIARHPRPTAMDATETLLAQLTNTPGASGFEYPVCRLLAARWEQLGASVKRDRIGNLVATVDSFDAGKPTVLIMAHMDEVGFLVTEIQENGFIKAQPLGGWLPHALWSHSWEIHLEGRVLRAISGLDPPHVLKDYKAPPRIDTSQLFFDAGLSRKELLDLGVRPGLPITPESEFRVLVPGKRYSGKAFDDRIALALITDLLARIRQRPGRFKHLNLQFAATVQEEVGMRGAKALASALRPDMTLNLEAGIARDYPSQVAQGTGPELGRGPTVFVFDGSMVPNPHLVGFIRDVAIQRHIPFQWESEPNYGQDACRLQCAPGGSLAINLGIPMRYPHSHHSLMDRQDYDMMLALLDNVLAAIGPGEIEAMR